MADNQRFSSCHVSVMAIANTVCDLWLSNKSVGALLKRADRPEVLACLGKALEDSFGPSAGSICDANPFGLAKVFLHHLLEAVHVPIPLGEDILGALVRIASEELRKDNVFHQLVASPNRRNSLEGPLKRGASKLFDYHESPIGKSHDASASAVTTVDSLDLPISWESEDSVSSGCSDVESGRRTIVFDWENTLMPSWWITHVLAPELSDLELANTQIPYESRLLVMQAEDELSREDSSFRGVLEDHARALVATLRAARAVADVAIVTLAPPTSFERSFAFLPGLDAQALFEDLEVRVVFPRGQGSTVSEEAGAAVKRQAMAEILGDDANVLWIDSQMIERDALKERGRRFPVARTIRNEPCLEDLTQDLRRLEPEFGRLLAHSKALATGARARVAFYGLDIKECEAFYASRGSSLCED